jgi:hypothetical protein
VVLLPNWQINDLSKFNYIMVYLGTENFQHLKWRFYCFQAWKKSSVCCVGTGCTIMHTRWFNFNLCLAGAHQREDGNVCKGSFVISDSVQIRTWY